MTQQIQINSVEPAEFAAMLAEAVRANIQKPETIELLTHNEAAKFLRITPKTLIDWRDKGIIIGHGIQSEVRYFKSDLIAALKRIETKKSLRK